MELVIDAAGHVLEPPDVWELPSTYVRRQCWISADPDERALPPVMSYVGTDRFVWATDYPHSDHGADYMEELHELAAVLDADARRRLIGENVAHLYGLE